MVELGHDAALSPLTLWLLGSPSGPEHNLEALNMPVLHWLSPYSGPRNWPWGASLGNPPEKADCPPVLTP